MANARASVPVSTTWPEYFAGTVGSVLLELPGNDHAYFVDPAAIAQEVERFLRGVWDRGGWDVIEPDRILARAIRCACAITEAVRELGLDVRAGLHTGECELVEGKVGGIAVHIGARIAAEAAPGEVLVSGTVKDLVAGSGIRFRERGVVELKGVPGKWRLYSVEPGAAIG